MANPAAEPFTRMIALGELIAKTERWMIFKAESPNGANEAVIDVIAYQALTECASAEMTSEDARDNALLELEIELENQFRANPRSALVIVHGDIRQAVSRYVP